MSQLMDIEQGLIINLQFLFFDLKHADEELEKDASHSLYLAKQILGQNIPSLDDLIKRWRKDSVLETVESFQSKYGLHRDVEHEFVYSEAAYNKIKNAVGEIYVLLAVHGVVTKLNQVGSSQELNNLIKTSYENAARNIISGLKANCYEFTVSLQLYEIGVIAAIRPFMEMAFQLVDEAVLEIFKDVFVGSDSMSLIQYNQHVIQTLLCMIGKYRKAEAQNSYF